MRRNDCLTDETIARYFGGSLDEQSLHDVESHLGNCAVCVDASERVAAGNELLKAIQAGASVDGGPVLDSLIHRVKERAESLETESITNTIDGSYGTDVRSSDELDASEASRPAISSEQFVNRIADSGLLSRSELETVVDSSPDSDCQQLARLLIKQKKLTSFQARQIYAGKGKSLTLGNYVILDKIGQGGMGTVLKAEHQRMERVVALKVLSPHLTKNADALTRFQREVKAVARLEHPNIVTAHDADEADCTHFLVMQYVEGADLSAIVREKGPLPVEQVVSCILHAARGLKYAHGQGVVHRDIKPANLLLDSGGTVKILDMGLARLDSAGADRDQLTGSGQIMGTVDYMAPEQALNTKAADARADIYSLGITLWYLLTGRNAYEGESTMAKLLAHRESPIPSLPAACPSAPPKLEEIFARMVAKKPEDRYQTMSAVITALEPCQHDPGSSACTTPLATRGKRQSHWRQHPVVRLASGAVALVLVAAIVFFVQTNKGTIRVEINHPDIEVTIKGTEIVLKRADRGKDIKLSPGDHTLVIQWDGIKFETDQLILKRGDKVTVRVDLLEGEVLVRQGEQLIGQNSLRAPPSVPGSTAGPSLAIAPFDASLLTLKHSLDGEPGDTYSASFSPNGKLLATSRQNSIVSLWDMESGKLVRELQEHTDLVRAVRFSPDGKMLATAGEDQQVLLWDSSTWEVKSELAFNTPRISNVAFSDDSRLVAACGDNALAWWNLPLEKSFSVPVQQAWEVAIAPGAEQLAIAGLSGIDLYDTGSGKFQRRLNKEKAKFLSVHYSPDARWIAAGCYDGSVHVWNTAASASSRTLLGHDQHVREVQFAPSGQFLATAGFGGVVNLWDPNTGTLLSRVETGGNGWTLAWSADSHFLVTSADRTGHFDIWQLRDQTQESDRQGWTLAPFDAKSATKLQQRWAGKLGLPIEKEVALPGGATMTFMLVPPGRFLMGSTAAEQARFRKQLTPSHFAYPRMGTEHQHKVRITQPFYLGKFEVTQAQWFSVMKNDPSHYQEGPDYPVDSVSWQAAQSLVGKINEATSGQHPRFTLPTEAQWEYACRSGTTTPWHCGIRDESLRQYASFGEEDGEGRTIVTVPVGQLKPNAFGLHDMHGNVWEWCADWFGEGKYYASSPTDDPTGLATGSRRVNRGGSRYHVEPFFVRSAYRGANAPDTRDPSIGFRLAMTIDVQDRDAERRPADSEEMP